MEKKLLTISVSGDAATGKSHIIYLLKEYLRKEGFDVTINDSDHSNETSFDNDIINNFNVVIERIKENSIITLNELHRNTHRSYIELTRQDLQKDKIDKPVEYISLYDFKHSVMSGDDIRYAEQIMFIEDGNRHTLKYR